jgi:V/A-type H+-transporting ATPase subunit C
LAGNPQDYLFRIPDFFNRHTKLDLVALSKVKTFAEFLEIIHMPGLVQTLRALAPQDGETIDYTMIEAAMDSFLYSRLDVLINKNFTGSTREELRRVYGIKAELDNVKMIYRAKKYYGASTDAIRAKLLPCEHGLINKRRQNALIMSATPEEFLRVLGTTPYGKVFAQLEEDGNGIDLLANRFLYKQVRSLMRFSNNPAVVMACCVTLFEFEIDDVTNILEGIRYRLPPDEIAKLLVRS